MGTPMTPLHFVPNKDSGIGFFIRDREPVSISWISLDISVEFEDTELGWIVSVKECDRDSDDTVTSLL